MAKPLVLNYPNITKHVAVPLQNFSHLPRFELTSSRSKHYYMIIINVYQIMISNIWEIQITGYITYGDSISQPSLLKEKCLLTIPSQHYSYQTRIHSKISSIYDPYFLMDRLTLSCFINTKQNSYSISKRDSNLQSLHLLAMALSMRYKYFL